jgi:oligosaccharide repeat unit polymerase
MVIKRSDYIILIFSLILAIFLGLLISFFGTLSLPIILSLAFFVLFVFLIFKNPFWGILLIAFFIPFERLASVEISGLTLRISQILGAITILSWFLKMLIEKNVRFKSNPIFIPIIIFLVINILSFTQAVNLTRAEAVFLFIAFTILIGVLVTNLVDSKEKLEKVIKVILLITLLITIFGIFQFAGDLIGLPTSITGLREMYTMKVFGFPRVQSTFLEPLYLANYLLLPICLVLAFLLARKSYLKWYWLIIILSLALINFVLALSRAAYLALGFCLVLIFIYYFKNLFSLKNILIFIAVLLIVYFVFMQVFGLTQDFNLAISKFAAQAVSLFTGASYTDRAETFSQAYQAFREHPWLGIGTGNFGPYVAHYPLIQPEAGWLIVNNEFLEILAETGIFGLLSFLFILGILFFRSIKAIQKAQDIYLKTVMFALFVAFLGVIIQYQTFSILYIMHIWFLFGLLVAVQNLILRKDV